MNNHLHKVNDIKNKFDKLYPMLLDNEYYFKNINGNN